MTQEQKQLLLQDLCGRLPYGTKVKCPLDDEPYTLLSINWNKEIVVIGFMMDEIYVTSKQKLVDVKPYLRPMSSMTDEEYNSIKPIIGDHRITFHAGGGFTLDKIKTFTLELIDWLNSHHFDYRGLIEQGLAISTEEFNPYKD